MAGVRRLTVSSSPVEQAFLDRNDEMFGNFSLEDRLTHLSAALQKLKDRPYEDPTYVAEPKFKIGTVAKLSLKTIDDVKLLRSEPSLVFPRR